MYMQQLLSIIFGFLLLLKLIIHNYNCLLFFLGGGGGLALAYLICDYPLENKELQNLQRK